MEEFISHLDSAIYKKKSNTFELLKHMNTDTEELANINHGPSKETFLHYYKELWINKLSSTQLLEYRKILKEIKIMEELKETLKKMKNHLVKIT